MRVINLTPDPVILADKRGQIVRYEPSGIVAGVEPREAAECRSSVNGLACTLGRACALTRLPRQRTGRVYLVLPLVAYAAAALGRWDVFTVDESSARSVHLNGCQVTAYGRLLAWDGSPEVVCHPYARAFEAAAGVPSN